MVLPVVRFGAIVLATYVGAAIAASWPLPRHLSTHMTGPPGSDAGIYLWNTWVFRHELVDLGNSPLQTDAILPLDGPTPLSLHNYTLFTDVASLALTPALGLLTTFNLLYLANVTLAGVCMFLLARRAARAAGGGAAEAWLAGLLFAWSPFLIARSTGHFSLVAAAPLPLFLYLFDRALERQRVRDAVWCGVCAAWAAMSDPYYGVYCLLLAGCLLLHRQVGVEWRGRDPRHRRAIAALDVTIAAVVAGALGLRLFAGTSLTVGPFVISMTTLHTPALAIVLLGAIRLLLTLRPRVFPTHDVPARALLRIATWSGLVAALLLSASLTQMVELAWQGELVRAPVAWRSSAPGMDLLSFILPNPMRMGVQEGLVTWLDGWPGGWAENIVSLPFVGLATLAAAWLLAGYRPHRLWAGITIGFALLAMGPFLRVAGVSTPIPMPWAFLRYVPLLGDARMPQRFAVVAVLGFAVLFGAALAALVRRYPARRVAILASVGLALGLELLPAPRALHAVRVPDVYRIIAADPRPVRVLDLPFGIRDGLSSFGDYNPSSQVFQTVHEKALIGGYLSRVPGPTRRFHLDVPLLGVLAEFSEGRVPSADRLEAARKTAPAFARDAALGYVVVDTSRATPALEAFAVEVLGLTRVSTSEQFVLYRPATVPTENVGG